MCFVGEKGGDDLCFVAVGEWGGCMIRGIAWRHRKKHEFFFPFSSLSYLNLHSHMQSKRPPCQLVTTDTEND